MDSNHRPQGYEPCELATALSRYILGVLVRFSVELQRHSRVNTYIFYPAVTTTGFVQLIPQGSQGVDLLLSRVM